MIPLSSKKTPKKAKFFRILMKIKYIDRGAASVHD